MRLLVFAALAFGCGKDKETQEPVDDRYQDGYDEGFAEGEESGLQQGRDEGFDNGQQEGYESGFESGYDSGYDDGYDGGYESGYEEGLAEGVMDPGWDLYTAGDYPGACSSFLNEASESEITDALAVGLGWCNLRQAQGMLASSWFEMAVAINEDNLDGWVGLASASMLLKDFALAGHAIEQTLLGDSGYTCDFEAIDANSLLTTQILMLLFERDMSGASIALSELDPTHQLVPLDSTSWIVDSVSYDSFQRAMIAKLNSMGGI